MIDRDENLETVLQADGGTRALEGTFLVTVVEGADKGRSIEIDSAQASRILLGTSPASDLRLTDPQVSRRHATIEVSGTGIRVADAGSTNGTFVDRVKVLAAELRGGEIVRLGSTILTIEPQSAQGRPAPLPAVDRFGRTLGASREMRRVYARCARIAQASVPVVIEGETGTGKEVLAEAIHEASPRAGGPFVVFDCTTVASNLIESELFGHERGAFTGAAAARKGVFEQADGGTLLIDEIGDLEMSLQPKLLRAIERAEVRRVGGDRWIRVDVRVVAATRRDLDREVALGRFRDDLFHRLAVARVELPPLRHRHGDVAFLARRFWADMGGDPHALPADVMLRWEDHTWPGNVRELRNAVARQLSLGEFAAHEPTDWGEPAPAVSPNPPTGDDPIRRVLEAGLPFYQAREQLRAEFEQRYVEHQLELYGGDVARAVAASGIGRRYFQVLRAKHK